MLVFALKLTHTPHIGLKISLKNAESDVEDDPFGLCGPSSSMVEKDSSSMVEKDDEFEVLDDGAPPGGKDLDGPPLTHTVEKGDKVEVDGNGDDDLAGGSSDDNDDDTQDDDGDNSDASTSYNSYNSYNSNNSSDSDSDSDRFDNDECDDDDNDDDKGAGTFDPQDDKVEGDGDGDDKAEVGQGDDDGDAEVNGDGDDKDPVNKMLDFEPVNEPVNQYSHGQVIATPEVEFTRIHDIEHNLSVHAWTKDMVRAFIIENTTANWSILGSFFKESDDPAIREALGPEEMSEATLVCLCCNVWCVWWLCVCGVCVCVFTHIHTRIHTRRRHICKILRFQM